MAFTRDAIKEKVLTVIEDVCNVDAEYKLHDDFYDALGGDSLDAAEIVMLCEEEFGIELPDEAALGSLRTVDAFVSYIAEKLLEQAERSKS